MAFKEKIIFTLILIFAIFIRLFQLNKFPVSLNWDEISHGYNAFSVLETGKDQWGTTPIFNFRAYGDYPTTLNLYLTIPFIKIFGLNEWSTRLPNALCGILIVIFSYLITESLFKKKTISLMTMFLAAISPWTFFTSRAVYQSTVAQAFLLIGIYFLINFLFNKKHTLFISLFFLNLSMYAYHNTRIFVPIFLFIVFIIFFQQFKKSFPALILGCLLFIPVLLSLFNSESRARSAWVSVLNPTAINIINENRRVFSGSPLLAKIIYNKVTYTVPLLVKNTINLFNPLPLFFQGSKQYQFNVVNHGLLFLITLPFFYYGLFIFIKKSKTDNKYLFLLLWYLIGLIPSIITTGDFPTLRLFLIIPLPFIAIALSTETFLKTYKNITVYYLLITVYLFSFGYYLHIYTTSYTKNYSQSWQYGYKEISQYVKENYHQYDQIIITKKYGEPHEFLLFYLKYDPALYQKNAKTDYHSAWYWVDSFDKFKFINDWEIKEKTQDISTSTLLITSPKNYNSNVEIIETINFLDNTPAFDIVKIHEK